MPARRLDVTIFDGNLNPVPATILANGNGTFRVQAANLKPGGNYFLEVAAPGSVGNYTLVVDGMQPAANLTTFMAGTLDAAQPNAVFQLYVAQSQLFSWLLTTQTADPGAGVVMEIFNSQALLVSTLTAPANTTVSGPSDFLTPGTYTVRFRKLGAGPISYTLRGDVLTEPIGPVLDDPTLHPQFIYNDATVPVLFIYPGNVISPKPYQWAVAANTPPSALTLVVGPASAGSAVTLSGSFADPDFLDAHTLLVDWGSAEPPTTLALGVNVLTFTIDHIFASPGVYSILVSLTDNAGGSTTAVTQVTVA